MTVVSIEGNPTLFVFLRIPIQARTCSRVMALCICQRPVHSRPSAKKTPSAPTICKNKAIELPSIVYSFLYSFDLRFAVWLTNVILLFSPAFKIEFTDVICKAFPLRAAEWIMFFLHDNFRPGIYAEQGVHAQEQA